MGDLDELIKKMRVEVQTKCTERIQQAQAMSIGKISLDKPMKEEYGTSYTLKKKHGL